MRKDIPEQPGADIAPDLGNQPGPNYTNQPSLPKIAYKRKSKVLQPGIRETDV